MSVNLEFINPITPVWFQAPPHRKIDVYVSRDGAYDFKYKEVLIWNNIYDRHLLAVIPVNNGVSGTMNFAANAIDGVRGVFIYDFDKLQPYGAVRTPSIYADFYLQIDLNDGTGGGTEATESATAPARVRVEKLPASRDVVALERKADGTWRYAGTTRIAGDGMLNVQVTGGDLFVMAADDYGLPFQPGLAIELGANVRPSRYQGWLYRCTEAGSLPTTEPEWWPEQGENPPRLVGTARLQAVRYYQPIAHGPINYERV